MKQLLNQLGRSIRRICLMVMVGMVLIMVSAQVYVENFSQYAMETKVREIYADIWRQTGQNQERLPLEVVNRDEINAYNDGKKIVIYTGLINSADSWDEIALVLGHEVAHGTLYHLVMIGKLNMSSNIEISVMEANADKMGAVYAMKAGYDVCRGRELFRHWLTDKGDSQGGDHPGYAYRYSELNIGCD